MSFRNISAWSIRNPVVPIVLFIGLMLAGLVSFNRMEVQNQPDIEFPMVIVTIAQPGAAPTEIETQITQRVESAVRSIAGVNSISSTATEGSSQTLVEFQLGEDINAAVNEVKNAVDQVRGDLPDGILEPQVIKAQTSSDPIAYFAAAADDMTLEQLSWFIDDRVAKRLLAIPGMATVTRGGGVNREILVTLDPARMQAAGVTASQVNLALRQLNTNAAGGRAEIAGSRQSVRVLGNARTAFQLSQTEIALGGGRSVKLADVARVSDSFGEVTSRGRMNGREVVTFGISRARGASDLSVYDETVKALDQLEKDTPGIHFRPLFTSVDYTRKQYESSMSAMVEGAVLAVIVVFFFLRDWRATVIAAIAIPLSAIPTFWFMDLLGFTLNQMSLLALGLVAGVLVDDAIVEIENIVRHMRMGKTAYQASIDAADEIGLAVVATTFSIVAVFLPVGLMPGVSGQFFKNFGLTVVVSVLMSLAVARMITPMVAAYFLKAHGQAEHAGGRAMDRYLDVLHWSLDTSKADAYRAAHRDVTGRLSWGRRFAARLRDHRVGMVGVAIGALLLTIVMFMVLPGQFFPDSNNDFVQVRIEMVPGTTLQQTADVSANVAAFMRKEPAVDSVLERISEGNARLFVTLHKKRDETSMALTRRLTPILQKFPDARITFQSMNGGGGGGGSGRPISIMLAGSDPVLLERTATQLVEEMKGLRQVVAPRIGADLRRPEVIIKPRLDLASSLGVNTQALSQAIRIATQGEIDQNAAKFSLSDRQVPIRVRMPVEARRDLSNIANLPVPTVSGGSVPLSRVAEIGFGSGPTSVQRYDQQRRVFIGADLPPGVVKSQATEAINNLPIMRNLPPGVTNKAYGEDRWQQEMISNVTIAVIAGILLVFSVLVLLYHRFVSPLVNMGSLFLAPLGGLLLLGFFGQPVSMPVLIGILMLLGIVAKNSILLIDFAIEEMAQGRDKFDAIIEAGHKRAVPIVMTTVAMTAGMLPTAISLGGDSAWRAPMGVVVIGGLVLSTALTLLIVPAAFSLADGLEKRLGPALRKRFLTFEPHHAHPAAGPAAQPAE
ncbi:efflux RND transporter permease subunit [Novosphingobium piscinae]|uniref:Efflux RND transporter permease subunit n=1 Tax=Novosphingobium piscinae TaxID=1507448 RepID=A0A7X1KRP2_9SPHN|nr:efflux RND transporter permease subunit [Novosphingobium piscinae]MBC2670815.1 efflux RND transporter permease subunit [Novosphingobium piscinae]